MSSGPIFITVWSGDDAVRVGRQLAGATDHYRQTQVASVDATVFPCP